MSTMAVCCCNVGILGVVISIVLGNLLLSHTVHGNEQPEFKEEVHPKDIVIVVISEGTSTSYHKNRTNAFNNHINLQIKSLKKNDRPSIILTYKKWPDGIGMWTVFPMLEDLSVEFPSKKWIFICEEETRVNIQKLVLILQKYDSSKELFLGKPLRDSSPSIIHHYYMNENFEFVDFSAGFLLSHPLLKSLAKTWPSPPYKEDFNIDPKHELSKYIWNDGKGVALTAVPELCTVSLSDACVTNMQTLFPDCGSPIPEIDLFVAVKTCEEFHKTRLQVVLDTWAKETSNIVFISEKEDKSIPTISLGVPNTERGHCGKTKAIIDKFVQEERLSGIPWLLIADDDTIISLNRLRKLLACYDPMKKIALGERYGFRAATGGYNYITGGGGMVFSRPAAKVLSDVCDCPALDSPDDMLLGMCLTRHKIPLIHSKHFHQARPNDYSKDFLKNQIPISFHKHWMNDPIQVYREWLVDEKGEDEKKSSRDEL